MSNHARLSPSAAKIWMTCPAMPSMAEKVEKTTSSYAEEGTAAHMLAQLCLERQHNAARYRGEKFGVYEVTEEMAAAVQVYLDYVRANTEDGDEVEIETKIKLNEHIWGTADFVRYRPRTRHLLIADYKHGKGVFVDVEKNPQALTYGVMAAKKLGNRGVDKVTLAIAQPRCALEGEGIREWTIDAIDLIEWEADLLAAMEATMAPEPKFFAGPHCRWCPAAAICPALARQTQKIAKLDFAPALPYKPEDLAAALHFRDTAKAWIKAVTDFAYGEAQRGRTPPGWKVVAKRPSRKWASESEAADFLKTYGMDDKDIYERKIKTPPAVEKIIGKKNADIIADLIVKDSSGVTLAPEYDKRPAIALDPSMDFTPVDSD